MSDPKEGVRGQYLRAKKMYPDAILFFRLGDFYETFDDDAKIVARECEVFLTSKELSKGVRVPLAGVPHHALDAHLARLVGKGYKVAICEQLTPPDGKTLVKREVTRVVSPGTLVEPELLDSRRNNYIAALLLDEKTMRAAGFAYTDITTGEFATTQFDAPTPEELRLLVRQELDRVRPAELLAPRRDQSFRRPRRSDGFLGLDDTEADDSLAAYRAIIGANAIDMRTAGAVPDDSPLVLSADQTDVMEDPAAKRARKEAERTEKMAAMKAEKDAETEAEADDGLRGVSLDVVPVLAPTDATLWQPDTARAALLAHFDVGSLEGFGCANLPLAFGAAGALVAYLATMQPTMLGRLNPLTTYSVRMFMTLDVHTRRNLELMESGRSGSKKHSLVGVLDRTRTPMGSRLLYKWINQPLVDLPRLQARQDAVAVLHTRSGLRDGLFVLLAQTYDMERLARRAATGIATAREMVSLRGSLLVVPDVVAALEGAGDEVRRVFASLLKRLDPMPDLVALLNAALTDKPPIMIGAGASEPGEEAETIRSGFDPALDELRTGTREDIVWMSKLQTAERERTGINSLKVGFNSVIGYYIEISKANTNAVPKDYIRKGTLVNAERYITPEMKDYENRILHSRDQIEAAERRAYERVLAEVGARTGRLMAVASSLAHLDVFAALAEVAVRNDYVRPTLNAATAINIVAGRHPVVERSLPGDAIFVPNDICLDSQKEQIILLTGPNMSGKSTAMRQVALIVLLAQIGAFVPAESATIGIVDRIFTRVGAQDDIATGQSTFMVEMVETANILNHATGRSLLILDEIGRGTSTYDGLAIARAVVEYIHNHPRLGCRTIFATHYHELVELAQSLPRVRNYNVAVTEEGDHVVFLRKIVPGGADRSYGIHVAQLAGLPRGVVKRAKELLAALEGRTPVIHKNGVRQNTLFEGSISTDSAENGHKQTFINANGNVGHVDSSVYTDDIEKVRDGHNTRNAAADALLDELRALPVAEMTPLEAITRLYELQSRARTAHNAVSMSHD